MAQPTKLFVCPTSHMDWDWACSFEEYYKTYTGSHLGRGVVQSILDAAVTLLGSESGTFLFNLAEIGWFQRYLLDQGGALPSAPHLTKTLILMGGAITSPDNIVCDGEAYVRAYLVGRQWAQAVGLGDAIANVSWMPDDFGHDPELPVILSAMGLTAVGFARVPGAFPLYANPLDGSSSLACSLMESGVAFNWQASDGSQVFAHFMPNMYGVPFYSGGSDGASNATAWNEFVQSNFLSLYSCPGPVVWPGDVAFAPAGGDFAIPDSGWVNGVTCFNKLPNNPTIATINTFPDYVVQASGASLQTTRIDPSNFYTGYFGSRPELKILQSRASRNLVAAEAVSSLLWLGSVTSSSALDALDGAIAQGWGILAPSTHHDFVTGTSPDAVYKMEQLPMLALAARLARETYRQAIRMIADSIVPSDPTGTLVVVHNPVAVARSGVFKLERGTAVSFGNSAATVQSLADGGLLVQSPLVSSLGYISGVVTFGPRTPPKDPVVAADQVTIDNGTLSITLAKALVWAIISIVPKGGTDLLLPGTAANLLASYTDNGGLYQYGNEPDAGGTFSAQPEAFTAGPAVQTEFGPLRWRVEAEITGPGGIKYLIGYELIAGESLIRMSVTGSADSGTTVVTTFPVVAIDGQQGTHLTYGTAHHFHVDAATPYWEGPMFKATHNFLLPSADSTGAIFPLAAIYHDGMPAWACDQGSLLGSLFRNTPGENRAAFGSDSDTHTQRYALRISATALDPSQGTPLLEALQVTNPLRAALASIANQPESPVTLPSTASLASVSLPALIRVVRPLGEVKSGAQTPLQAQVALRLYRPDADGQPANVNVTIPVLTANATAAVVTALEQPIAGAAPVSVAGDLLTVPTSFAVTTVAITAYRPTEP